jgi:ubiquinone/menaquinone biosynthesis C-methylase UbiE
VSRYEDVQGFYASYDEASRLDSGAFQLERERTREILERHLPPPPAVVLDVGGGPGAHARWLAGRGYEVHLVDVVPRHVEQARRRRPGAPALASAEVGDARRLDRPDASCDVVLLLGPLYHLTDRAGRLAALGEARRVLRPGGRLFAAAISRFASLLDALVLGIDDPRFSAIVTRDLADGQHRNPTDQVRFFTEAYFHRPEELRAEIDEAGFDEVRLLAVEGPGTAARDFEERWAVERRREELLGWIRSLEGEPSLVGASPHVMALARRP